MTFIKQTFIALSLALPLAATAAPPAFDAAEFEAAQAADKPILVHVTAPWCGTCRAQKPVVEELLKKPEFQDFAAFEVDFDSQKDALTQLNVQRQSTMIVYRGEDERARTLGETDRDAIEANLQKALAEESS